MERHPYAAALGIVALMCAAAWAVLLFAVEGGAVIGPVEWAVVALSAVAVIVVLSVLFVWLAVRPLWDRGRPRTPSKMLLHSGWGPQHRPEERKEAPWWYVCELSSPDPIYPAIFRVTVSEPAQLIRGTIWKYDKLADALSRREPGESVREALDASHFEAGSKDREPMRSTLDFYSTALMPEDKLTVVVESTSPGLRIRRIKRVRRRR
jgi:hypothetical protein